MTWGIFLVLGLLGVASIVCGIWPSCFAWSVALTGSTMAVFWIFAGGLLALFVATIMQTKGK